MQNRIAAPQAASQAEPADFQTSIRKLSSVKKQSDGGGAQPGLELVELELALDSMQAEQLGFSEAVGSAVQSLGGEVLFSLPASGLAEGQQKIAAVRLPADTEAMLLFVFLSEDGTRTTVRLPDEETSRLADFSEAFIDLLEKF